MLPCGVPDAKPISRQVGAGQCYIKLSVLVIHKGHHAWAFGRHHYLLAAVRICESRLGRLRIVEIVHVFGYHDEANAFNANLALLKYRASFLP